MPSTMNITAPRSTEIDELLAKVRTLLDADQPKAALEAIAKSRLDSPWLVNARGVCQLRLGDTTRAVDTFRGLSLATNMNLRDDVPATFKTNYAQALLADGNLSGFEFVLGELHDDPSPNAVKLREAFQRFRGSLSFGQRLMWMFGSPPKQIEILNPPYGDLE